MEEVDIMGMKKRLVAAMFLLILAVLFGIVGFAAEADIYGDNIAVISDRCEGLNGEMERYVSLDTSPDKSVAIRTSTVIVEYYNMINALRADPRIASQSLSDEVELIYLKGVISGECAWIYESHIDSLDGDRAQSVRDYYTDTLNSIAGHSDITSLRALEESYPTEITLSVYREKIEALYSAQDSLEIAVIVAGALEDIKGVADGTLIDQTYEEIYQRVQREISVQRIRERAQESFIKSYAAVCLEGAIIVLACIIFSLFAASPPAVDPDAAAVSMVK